MGKRKAKRRKRERLASVKVDYKKPGRGTPPKRYESKKPPDRAIREDYQFLCASEDGFVQMLAYYVSKGYLFYSVGELEREEDGPLLDQRQVTLYNADISKDQRYRRKRRGKHNVHYLRCGRTHIRLGTLGTGVFYARENFKSARYYPIKVFGYSISTFRGRDGKWHATVRIEESIYRDMWAKFKAVATEWDRDRLEAEFSSIPYSRYQPIREQLKDILYDVVNKPRRKAGLPLVREKALRLSRRNVQPWVHPEEVQRAA